MEEIGLFPLGIVLLPSERVPLHIFEPRYRELIGECIELDQEFGLLCADESGIREDGTRARGRGDPGAIRRRSDEHRRRGRPPVRRRADDAGRSFMTAEVAEVEDEKSGWQTTRGATQSVRSARWPRSRAQSPEIDE